MAPRLLSTSNTPELLLWATQLKREHAFLLERMTKVESGMQQAETVMKGTRLAHGAIVDFTNIAEQVRIMFEKGSDRSMEELCEITSNEVKSLGDKTEIIAIKIAEIKRSEADIEEDRKRALNKEKALLKRISEIEGRQNSIDDQVSMLRSDNSDVMYQELQRMSNELMKLRHEAEKDKVSRETLNTRVESLEHAKTVLEQENKELKRDVHVFAQRNGMLPQPPANSMLIPPVESTFSRSVAANTDFSTSTVSKATGQRKETVHMFSTVKATDSMPVQPRRQLKNGPLNLGKHNNDSGPCDEKDIPDQQSAPQIKLDLQHEAPVGREDLNEMKRLNKKRKLTGVYLSPLSISPAFHHVSPQAEGKTHDVVKIENQDEAERPDPSAHVPSRIQQPPKRRRAVKQSHDKPEFKPRTSARIAKRLSNMTENTNV